MFAVGEREKQFALAGAAAGAANGVFYVVAFDFDSASGILGPLSWFVGFGGLGLAVCLALAFAQARYSAVTVNWGRALRIGGACLLVCGVASAILSVVSFALGRSIGVGEDGGRFIGWLVSGMCAGYAISYFVPNLDRQRSALGGALGGILGCTAMYIFLQSGIGLILGSAIAGAGICLAAVLVDKLTRESWLEVVLEIEGGAGRSQQFDISLGSRDIVIGYDKASDIRVESIGGTQSVYGTIVRQAGQTLLHATSRSAPRRLRAGDQFKISNATITYRESQ
jgi:hypothetical protein